MGEQDQAGTTPGNGNGGEAAASGGAANPGGVIIKPLPPGTLSKAELQQQITDLTAKLAAAQQAAAQAEAAKQAAETRAMNAAANQRVAQEAATAADQLVTQAIERAQHAETRLVQANQQLQAAEARAGAATQAQQVAEQRAATLQNSLNTVTANATRLNSQLTDATACAAEQQARADQAESENARLRQFQSLGAVKKPNPVIGFCKSAFKWGTLPLWGPFWAVYKLGKGAWNHKRVTAGVVAVLAAGGIVYKFATDKPAPAKPDTQAKLLAENARLRAEAQRVLDQPKIQPAAPTTVTAVEVPKTDQAPKAALTPGLEIPDARLTEVAIGREGNILTNYRMLSVGKGDDAKIVGEIIVIKDLTDGKVTHREATEAESLAGKTFMATKEVVVLKNVLYTSDVVYPGRNIAATVEQDGNNFKVKSIGPATAEQMALVKSGKHGYKGEPHLPDPVRGVYRPKQVIDKPALPDATKMVGDRFVIGTDGKVSAVTVQDDGSFKASVPGVDDAYKALLISPDAPKFDGKLVSGLLNMDNQERVALGLAAIRRARA